MTDNSDLALFAFLILIGTCLLLTAYDAGHHYFTKEK